MLNGHQRLAGKCPLIGCIGKPISAGEEKPQNDQTTLKTDNTIFLLFIDFISSAVAFSNYLAGQCAYTHTKWLVGLSTS